MVAIPGVEQPLGSSGEEVNNSNIGEVEIGGFAEWRLEVPFRTILRVKVVEGIGEIFGTELPNNVEIELFGVKYAIYAPVEEGCKVQYYTVPNKTKIASNEESEISEYVSEESTMNQCINLHFLLEYYRQSASEHNFVDNSSGNKGPRVLILGNRFSGKSTVSKMLSSYAAKMDRAPVLVNLNPSEGVFSVPGSLTATPISDALDLESVNGWGWSPTSGSTVRIPKQPLVKNFGLTSFTDNLELYKHQVSKLGVAVMSRLEEDSSVKNSGVIIDTPPLTSKDFNIIENIVSDFEVNFIVVIGNERLLIDLRKRFKHKVSNSMLDFIKISRSGGTLDLDDSFIRQTQQECVQQYFYGNFRNRLSPFTIEVDINDYVIYRCVLTGSKNEAAFLPSGDSFDPDDFGMQEENKDELLLEKYYTMLSSPKASDLENAIVAVTQIPQMNRLAKDLMNACVLGYVYISKVDETRGKMKVLLPFPGALPRNILIVTAIRYAE